MKTEKIERITKALQDAGFGWISKEDCRKIILLVQGELVVDAVFTPLERNDQTQVEALSAALRDAVNVFLAADESPGQVLCTGERREAWEETLRVHGRTI